MRTATTTTGRQPDDETGTSKGGGLTSLGHVAQVQAGGGHLSHDCDGSRLTWDRDGWPAGQFSSGWWLASLGECRGRGRAYGFPDGRVTVLDDAAQGS